jgi:LemA protein
MELTLFNILGIVGVVLLVVFLIVWSLYNQFVRKINQLKTDYSDVEIQVRRRASLIEQLAQMVKEYAKHERDTFKGVAAARSALDTSKSPHETAQAENMFTQTLRSLFMVTEAYPKLLASGNYKQVREDLKESENLVARYREEYNQSVQDYNTSIQTFPNLLVAGLLKFKEEELFQPQESK